MFLVFIFYCLRCCCFNNISVVIGGQVEGAARNKFGALAQAPSIEIGTVLIAVLTTKVEMDICYVFRL